MRKHLRGIAGLGKNTSEALLVWGKNLRGIAGLVRNTSEAMLVLDVGVPAIPLRCFLPNQQFLRGVSSQTNNASEGFFLNQQYLRGSVLNMVVVRQLTTILLKILPPNPNNVQVIL